MKIGIVTFHFAYNYGAVLQAWALQTYLSSLGNDVEIINYRPKYHTERYQVIRDVLKAGSITYYNKHLGLLRSLRAIIGTAIENLYLIRVRIKKKKHFENFIHQFISQSEIFKTYKDLELARLPYDALITGSDQVWNQKLTNDSFDAVYFLKFGSKGMRRIAYAVSLGETSAEACANYLKTNNFVIDMLSCREEDTTNVFNNNLGIDCACVPDPTLLVGQEDYNRMLTKPRENNYALVYILKKNDVLIETIKKIKEKGNIIINISPINLPVKGMQNVYPISPSQFLGYIKYADIVITNSFHGTVFSLIFNKKFVCGLHGVRNQRIISLLEKVGLINRLLTDSDDLDILLNNVIDYNDVNDIMDKISQVGKIFLKKALQI